MLRRRGAAAVLRDVFLRPVLLELWVAEARCDCRLDDAVVEDGIDALPDLRGGVGFVICSCGGSEVCIQLGCNCQLCVCLGRTVVAYVGCVVTGCCSKTFQEERGLKVSS